MLFTDLILKNIRKTMGLWSVILVSCYFSSGMQFPSDSGTNEEENTGPGICTEPPANLPSLIFEQIAEPGRAVTLDTDGCNAVYAAWQHEEEIRFISSQNAGISFGEPLVVGLGYRPYLLVDDKGDIHLLVIHDGVIIHRTSQDMGASFEDMTVINNEGYPLLGSHEPVFHHVADTRGRSEIAVVWKTIHPEGIWFASTKQSGFFDEPLMLFEDEEEVSGSPRLCLGGESRVVIVWLSGTRDHTAVFGAVSDDKGETFSVDEISETAYERISLNVDVDCAEDSRAVAAWVGNDGDIRFATLERSGQWELGECIMCGNHASMAYHFYPHLWAAGDRALITWRSDYGTRFGYAVVNFAGDVVAEGIMDLDFNRDGEPDRLIYSCSLPTEEGFMVLTQGRYPDNPFEETTVPGIVAFLDLEGEIIDYEELGPYGSNGIDVDMACDQYGRALMLWNDNLMSVRRENEREEITFTSWMP